MVDDWKSYYKTVYPDWWIAKASRLGNEATVSPYSERLMALVKAMPGQSLLDCGCGTGVPLAVNKAMRGVDVTAVDLAEKLVVECRRNFDALSIHGRFLMADAEALPFDCAVFDTVCCLSTTWYLPNFRTACGEMTRVTKEGGTIIFDVINLIHPGQLANYLQQLFSRTKAYARLRAFRSRLLGRPAGSPQSSGRWSARTPWHVLRVARELGLECEVRGFYVLLPTTLPILGERANLARHSATLSYGVAGNSILKWFGAKLVLVCTKETGESVSNSR